MVINPEPILTIYPNPFSFSFFFINFLGKYKNTKNRQNILPLLYIYLYIIYIIYYIFFILNGSY
ncbi:hypothetical protein CLU79DRAFT_770290 [Phycomyces nitens]|nr:hypothetical protein CLU79DRAFT_770290 [Phycomyces nitens]